MQVSENTLKAVQALAVHMINNPINATSVVEWLIKNDPMQLANALGLTVDYDINVTYDHYGKSIDLWNDILDEIIVYCKRNDLIPAIKALRQYSSDQPDLKTLGLVDAKNMIYCFTNKITWWSLTDEQRDLYRKYFGTKTLNV